MIHSSIKQSMYKIIRIIKFIFVILYSILVFFEKPFHCYKKTTFYTIEEKQNDECDSKLQYMDTNLFINRYLYRSFELFFLISFLYIQLILGEERKILNKFNNAYRVLQINLMVLIGLCIVDIFFSILFGYFPLINFFLRGFVLILLVRNLRMVWINMMYLFYATKNVFFLLFCVIFCFGILGYFMFNYSEDFSSVYKSLFSLYILLTTCNFPDVMLGTFTMRSKNGIGFFILYILINYFIIFSLLKSLYYSSFFQIFKEHAKKLLGLITEVSNENLTSKTSFQELMYNLNRKYSLTNEEYDNIIELLHENEKFTSVSGNHTSKKESKSMEILRKKSTRYHNYEEALKKSKIIQLLNKKYVELGINCIDLILIMFCFGHFIFDYKFLIVLQLIWCSFFIVEYAMYIYYASFSLILHHELIRSIFCFVNLLTFILLVVLLILDMTQNSSSFSVLVTLTKPLIILRSVRVIILLNKFSEFRVIFTTLHNMKTIFYGLLMTLFSFYYMFSTFSMFLTGGKITTDAFDNMKDIPNAYVNVNFNDFGSSFLSCFCLTMVNNINIIARSLSYKCSDYFQAYFATFYFISTLIILNICQTLLLEMYLIIKSKKLI